MRLLNLNPDEQFSFVCLPGQVAKITKVIDFRNGQVIDMQKKSDGIVMTVSKKPLLSGK